MPARPWIVSFFLLITVILPAGCSPAGVIQDPAFQVGSSTLPACPGDSGAARAEQSILPGGFALSEDSLVEGLCPPGGACAHPNRATVWSTHNADDAPDLLIFAGPDGAVWTATRDQLVRMSGDAWSAQPIPYPLESLALGPDGRFWGTNHGEVVMLDGRVWRVYPAGEVAYALTVLVTPAGDVWAAGDGGIARWNGTAFTQMALGSGDNGRGDSLLSAASAPDGAVWFGSGVFPGAKLLRVAGDQRSSFLDERQLGGFITSIAVDRQGMVWGGLVMEGSTGRGLFRWDGKSLRRYGRSDGLVEEYVVSVAIGPDDAVWAATLDGVYRFDGREFLSYLPKKDFSAVAVTSAGEVWLRSPGEVTRLSYCAGG